MIDQFMMIEHQLMIVEMKEEENLIEVMIEEMDHHQLSTTEEMDRLALIIDHLLDTMNHLHDNSMNLNQDSMKKI